MAQGFLQSFDKRLEVSSAGTEPAQKINQNAVRVMHEAGVDISCNRPENVSKYVNDGWDYVITVCDEANETCPVFQGKVKHRLHFGFEDPSQFKGNEDELINEFRTIRDKIKITFYGFYKKSLI